ncbi:hypothetical protein [Amycolatopsis sp. NPDC021455]|uniref:hypothetical protein n=1 Tax=Amycolatopsis sp. NPDC021455 TaxID=3154901 RepID=UPI0033F8A09D
MDRELVRFDNGRVVFGQAVSHLAEALNPLGAAARIFAESCACAVEMRQLSVEGRRIDAAKVERLTALADRRVAVGASLKSMHNRVDHAELSASSLRERMAEMQLHLVRPGVSLAEKQLYLEALRFLTENLVNQHSVHGDELVRHVGSVLGRPPAPPALPTGNKPRRRRR